MTEVAVREPARGRPHPDGRDAIGVAVVASPSAARARLEALVAARPGLRLVASRSAAAAPPHEGRDAEAEASVLLLDPGPRRAEAALGELSGRSRRPAVILLAGDLAPAASARLLRAGVRGVLPRDAPARQVAAAVLAVAAGLVVLHPSMRPAGGTRGNRGRPAPEPLTAREVEILAM